MSEAAGAKHVGNKYLPGEKDLPGTSKEQLLPGFRGGAMENVGADGKRERNPNRAVENGILDAIRQQYPFHEVSESDAANGWGTRMLVTSLGRIRPLPQESQGLGQKIGSLFKGSKPATLDLGGYSRDDVAVAFTFRGHNLLDSRTDVSAQLNGIAVFSREGFLPFYNEVVQHPEALFALARTVNGGHIRRQDGGPAQLEPGRGIVILPNAAFGGKLVEAQTSKPFAEGFVPNIKVS